MVLVFLVFAAWPKMACVPHVAIRAVDHVKDVSTCFDHHGDHANDDGTEENRLCCVPSLLMLRYNYYNSRMNMCQIWIRNLMDQMNL